MNRKNNRIKSQIVDMLVQEFNDPVYWVREMDYEQNPDWGFTSSQESKIRAILRDKLNCTVFINLRLPVTQSSPRRDEKNQPAINLQLKVNGPTIDIKWTIAPKFGTCGSFALSGMSARMENYDLFFEKLRHFIELNYKTGDFSRRS